MARRPRTSTNDTEAWDDRGRVKAGAAVPGMSGEGCPSTSRLWSEPPVFTSPVWVFVNQRRLTHSGEWHHGGSRRPLLVTRVHEQFQSQTDVARVR